MDDVSILSIVSLTVGIFSVAIAIVSIWLSLYHKTRADEVNENVRSLLQQVSTDAQVMKSYAFEQLTKVQDRMMERVFEPIVNNTGEDVHVERGHTERGPSAIEQATTTDTTLVAFRQVVERMDDGDNFSSDDRDIALGLVRRIIGTDVEESAEFAILLERLLDNLAAAGQYVYLDTIDDWLATITATNSGINKTMIQGSGYRLLASTSTPPDRDVGRFKRHMANARDLGNEHLALVVWLIHNFAQGNTREVEEAFGRIEVLDEVQRVAGIALITLLSDESNIGRNSTRQSRLIAERAKLFQDANQDRIDELQPSRTS